MFKKLKRKTRNLNDFDPSVFDDPVAMQTEWIPEIVCGTNFKTHRLVILDSDRIQYKASIGSRLFGAIFFLSGMGVIFDSIFDITQKHPFVQNHRIFFGVFGLPFVIVGGWFLYFYTKPIVFDKLEGCFWKGWRKPEKGLEKKVLKNFVKFHEIHALQLLSEHHSEEDESYDSFELNLVMKTGKRQNVVVHFNLDTARKDAATLSAFLEKPVWDAIFLERPEVG